jgi:predicted transposase/invertase (TIGR01784 family)
MNSRMVIPLDAMDIPKILPPSDDSIFKTLLTHPSAEAVLRDVISSVLNLSVLSAEVRSNELPVTDVFEKQERFDVNCTIDGGKQIELEMQCEAMKGDSIANRHKNIKTRCVYYVCDLHSSQPSRGDSYGDMLKTYQITFCGYTIFENHADFISRFSLKNDEGVELTDAISLVFIELSKLGQVLKKPVKEMTATEMWSVFFGYADNEKYREVIRGITSARKEISMASELLASISQNETERARFRARKKWRSDYNHNMIMSRREGLAEGKAEGLAEGLAEGEAKGEHQKAVAIARNLLSLKMPIDQIAQATGLTPRQIETL